MTSPLRRRGLLAPILPYRELESENQTDPFTVLYISPCQTRISNDPLHATDDFQESSSVPCNVSSFECFAERGVTNETTVSTLVVSYQYELWTNVGANFNQTVKGLESFMLRHLASITGLDTCSSSLSSITREVQSFSAEQMYVFAGMESAPADSIDDKYDNCVVPVQSSSVSNSICQPMVGSVTALINADLITEPVLEDSLRNGMLRLVREGMINDVYISGNISKVSFIGTRADDTGLSTTADRNIAFNTDSGDPVGLTTVGLAFVVMGSFLVLALLALFVKRRRQRKEDFDNVVFVDATVAPRELDSADNERGSKRAFLGYSKGIVGASARSPLAYDDSLALQPQDSDAKDSEAEQSFDSTSTAAVSMSPNSTPSTSPDKSNTATEQVIDTSSLDGANEDAILDRLHDIAEADEDSLCQSTDDDDSVHRLKRIA